jgi:hypothetical protein
MNIKSSISLCIALLFFSGCTTMRVKTKQDKSYAFEKAKTYQWLPPLDHVSRKKNLYVTADVQKIFELRLKKAGLKAVTKKEDADLQVLCYIEFKEQSIPVPGDSYSPATGVKRSNFDYSEYDSCSSPYPSITGTFTVIVFDTTTGKQVWKGTVKSTVDRSKTPQEIYKHVEIVVDKLLNHLPSIQKI